MKHLALAISLGLSGCATVNGVPQTPCQRAQRAADTARAAVEVARTAGLDPIIIAKLETAAGGASEVVVGVCGAT